MTHEKNRDFSFELKKIFFVFFDCGSWVRPLGVAGRGTLDAGFCGRSPLCSAAALRRFGACHARAGGEDEHEHEDEHEDEDEDEDEMLNPSTSSGQAVNRDQKSVISESRHPLGQGSRHPAEPGFIQPSAVTPLTLYPCLVWL